MAEYPRLDGEHGKPIPEENLDGHGNPIRYEDGLDDIPELSLEESNQARLNGLQAIGVGVNGVNEALQLRMLEALLGPVLTDQVKQAHQEWLATTLDGLEQQVREVQAQQAEAQRKATLLNHGGPTMRPRR